MIKLISTAGLFAMEKALTEFLGEKYEAVNCTVVWAEAQKSYIGTLTYREKVAPQLQPSNTQLPKLCANCFGKLTGGFYGLYCPKCEPDKANIAD